MTISILGCGWLGLPLGAHLARRGHRVKGSTTTPDKLDRISDAGITPYLLRLDPSAPLDAGDFFDADALFLNVPPRRRQPEVAAAYPALIERVVEAVAAAPVGFVVFASSTSVYPDVNGPVTEASEGEPDSASGRALLEVEGRLRAAAGFDATIIRFAGLYGYDRLPGRFLAGRTALPGGDAPVNLIHRDDCVALTTAIIERNVRGEVFNACADEHPSRRVLYTQAARRQGFEPPTFGDEPAPFKIVRNDHLKLRLGYRFLHPDPLQEAP